MNGCEYHKYASAWHDGELQGDARRRFEAHAQSCPACAAELAALRELSERIAGAVSATIGTAELARLHEAVDAETRRQAEGRAVMRMSGLLGALAASVLIVTGAWWMDLRSGHQETAGGGAAPMAMAPEWERVAVTLRATPRPGLVDDSPFSPRYAAAVDFMLSSLPSTERKTWGKPSL